jgi:hypothetical protein
MAFQKIFMENNFSLKQLTVKFAIEVNNSIHAVLNHELKKLKNQTPI